MKLSNANSASGILVNELELLWKHKKTPLFQIQIKFPLKLYNKPTSDFSISQTVTLFNDRIYNESVLKHEGGSLSS